MTSNAIAPAQGGKGISSAADTLQSLDAKKCPHPLFQNGSAPPRGEIDRSTGIAAVVPTVEAVNERQEARLTNAGLIVALAKKNSSELCFFAARSLYRPKRPDSSDEQMLARLPYIFTASRVALHLQCMARDHGSIAGLADWPQEYVDAEQVLRADRWRRPLAAATIEITEISSRLYRADLSIAPRYQLDAMVAVPFRVWLTV